MNKNTKRGYLTVEAGIFLPIFIIGVLTLAYLIKLLAVQEGVFHSFMDESRKLSSEAYIYDYVPFFQPKLINRLYEENPIDISNIKIDHFHYLNHYKGYTGIISMNLNYNVNLRLPVKFYDHFPIMETVVLRGFIGLDEDIDPMPFEDMEKEEESNLVWIFPIAGGRYHQDDCTYISSEPRQLLLTNSIKRRFDPCHVCEPNHISNGNFVYCYMKSGGAYHSGKCPVLDKYVISIEKDDAMNNGYTPCLKCGGG